MLILSYAWHGIFMNDMKYLGNGPDAQLFLHIVGYLVLGLTLTCLLVGRTKFHHPTDQNLSMGMVILSGSMTGVLIGFAIEVTSYHLNTGPHPANAWADLYWQMTEQASGGLLAAIGLQLQHPEREMKNTH
ncbi:MAG: hypothetical protein ACK46G_00280 [Flavobacteriales bacterium]